MGSHKQKGRDGVVVLYCWNQRQPYRGEPRWWCPSHHLLGLMNHEDWGISRGCTEELFSRHALLNAKCPCCAPYFSYFNVIMRLLESAVSPGAQVSSPGYSFICVLWKGPAHPELKHLPPFLGSPTHETWEKALLHLTTWGKPKGSHCFGSCTNQQTLSWFPKLPWALCPLLKGLRAGATPALTHFCQNPHPWGVWNLGIVVADSSLWDFIIWVIISKMQFSPSVAVSYWKHSLSAGHLHLFTAQLLPLV